ncbi:4-alpha-glucanotransferase [Acetobacteraceae bacterium KSS8]|uniref:4-alpha-glucanotransferase n=1 Tax=Endosaccharibacter trunci TaxID=2812733 RepID=A0ABT1W4V5_9PROT|nr:4-alpha-glucanotransferase [Acetobacteraceae bacterium KSS8]
MNECDTMLHQLCDRAGLSTRWVDAFGQPQQVEPSALKRVLGALGIDAGSEAAMRDAIEALRREDETLPPLLTGDAGSVLDVPGLQGSWTLTPEEDGETARGNGALRLPERPGYYRLEAGPISTRVAVAPERCFTLSDAMGAAPGGGRAWGLAQQLYALRRPGDGGVGDFAALRDFVVEAAGQGAASVSISPVHAQFSADPDRFSPYAPSSRIMLNVLHIAAGDPGDEAARLEALDLVDWPAVGRDRLQRLRRTFESGGDQDPLFAEWRAAEGDKLESHAVFEALHAQLWREEDLSWHWRDWPEDYRAPGNQAVRDFAATHAPEVSFHAWLQWRADRELAAAQSAARDAGMSIGLIADLAVGTDSGGSHCWSRQDESLVGLTVGAPPDLLQKNGQNWGITAFSGRGLRRNGFRAFIEMLSGAMRHAGGVRIDHAMGLNRLWVVPEGVSASAGAFLQLPEADLLRLLKLESVRNRAVVLGEDLGTVPEGFGERLERAGIDGMRVLWFEKAGNSFKPPASWTRQASAMTSTHDLPTVAGWWKGIDIAHRRALGGTEKEEAEALDQRAQEREQLWSAFLEAGAAQGAMPAVWDAIPVVDAAVSQVARADCELAVLPIEDVLGLEEQPNIPGTVDEHPNWRRRLHAPVGAVLADERAALRLRVVDQLRRP